jgi:hypothetical protein
VEEGGSLRWRRGRAEGVRVVHCAGVVRGEWSGERRMGWLSRVELLGMSVWCVWCE